jgi:hypothetical protein
MRIDCRENRQILKKAKSHFSKTAYTGPRDGTDRSKFWEDFGEAYDMNVIIDKWIWDFPDVSALEFNTEEAYVWFMLRWS